MPPIEIVIVPLLSSQTEFKKHVKVFDLLDVSKIFSYHHLADQTVCFVSELLQKYYLSTRIGQQPQDLKHLKTSYQKPFVSQIINGNACSVPQISYNISHTRKFVALVICYSSCFDVGIDIEEINPDFDFDGISQIVFSQTEGHLVTGSAKNFFKLWTKKEAFIKALGTGFAEDYYKNTAFNLANVEESKQFVIATTEVANHMLSVCVYKKT